MPWESMADHEFSLLYVNGRFYEQDELSLSALDRGFTLGDGVFETMRAYGGRIFRLSQHLQRMRHGASLLRIPMPREETLAGALGEVLSRSPDVQVTVRVTLTRGVDHGRGIAPPRECAPTLVIRLVGLSRPSAQLYLNGCRVIVSTVRRNQGSPLSRVKSCNYGDSILARLEAESQGADESILLNQEEEVACASTANLFFVREGILHTPPETSGALAGITRACILESAGVLGIPTRVCAFSLAALQGADEAFLSNTVVGILPLREVEGKPVGSAGRGKLTTNLTVTLQRLMDAELTTA